VTYAPPALAGHDGEVAGNHGVEVLMGSREINRRQVVRAAAGVAAGGALLGGAGVAPALASERHTDRGLLGSWLLEHRDDPPAPPSPGMGVVSFAPGGAIIENDISPEAGLRSGSWAMTGRSTFKATLWSAAPTEVAVSGATVRVRVEGRLRDDSLAGTAAITGFAPDGSEMFSGTGTFTATRLRA
jgi:hypothetical protein